MVARFASLAVVMRTHNDSLKVARDAPEEVIKAAYRALAQRWHPDRNPSRTAEAARIMQILNAACETLSDPEQRRAYDESLRRQEQTSDQNVSEAGPSGKTRRCADSVLG
jgi:DnaJ-class molecular chaperone